MDVVYCKPSEATQKSNAWSRQQIAERLDAFEAMDSPWISHARIARFLDVPRTTLEYWLKQRESLRRESNLPGEVIDFFESPIGLAFLHQLIGAAHLVFVQANDCGIRNLCWFLELSRLNTFVAASYGAQHAVATGDLPLSRRNLSPRDVPGRHRTRLEVHSPGTVSAAA
jgi:hypothetical protein